MAFNHIKPQKSSDLVMEQIRTQIESGDYPPGSRLPTVINLAESFEVGRSTIREALSALKAMGWIDIRHGGGSFVKAQLPSSHNEIPELIFSNIDSFQELLDTRKFIETGCASLAAKNRTNEDIEKLKAILYDMENALEDEEQSEMSDVKYHMQIAYSSHNSLFIQFMEILTQRLQENMKESRKLWFFSESASKEQLLKEHRTIFHAILSKNEVLAGELISKHIQIVDEVVKKLNTSK